MTAVTKVPQDGKKKNASTVNRTQGLKIFSLALSQLSYRGFLLLDDLLHYFISKYGLF